MDINRPSSDGLWRINKHGPIARLVLSNPEQANAMKPQFWRELPNVVHAFEEDPSIRVLVVSAEGRNFSAGMELQAFRKMEAERNTYEEARWRERFRANIIQTQQAFASLRRARFPVIAVVHGAVIGGAIDLIASCDIRFASADAYFCVMETNVAMVADMGTLPELARIIPEGILKELLFTGRNVGADEAKRIGLVNDVFGDERAALGHALEIANQIASRSPLVVSGLKDIVAYGRTHDSDDVLRYVATWQAGMFSFSDVSQAIEERSTKKPSGFADLVRGGDLFGEP